MRVHQDVDVGGSYGVKRGIKQTVLVAHLARRLGRPVRLIEDRLENMRGGDAHGPDRIFDVEVAFNDDGIVKSMKMRALDNVGAYAGRAPFQLGKPIGAIVGPYKIESVQYRAQSRDTNKAVQEAVRGFGQAPTNYAIETAIDKVAAALGLDRIEVRRRNFIRKERVPLSDPERHAPTTAATITPWSTRCSRIPTSRRWKRSAIGCARPGMLAGIGIAACLEPSGGNSSFEPLLNEKNTTTTWMDSCRINVDGLGFVTVTIHNTSSGQGHETLVVDRDRRSAADRSRPDPRGAAGFAGVPAVELAGRQPDGDHARRRRVPCRAEAEGEADADRRASIRPRRGQGRSTLPAASTIPTRGRAARLGRTRQYRPSQLSSAAGGHGARARGHACDAGADRRHSCRRTAACRCIRATPSNFTWC